MSKPLTHQVITLAREIIGKKERWVQGADAMCARGQPVSPIDSRATRFCACEAG